MNKYLLILFLLLSGISYSSAQMTEAGLKSYTVKTATEQTPDTANVQVYYNQKKLESYVVVNSPGFKNLEISIFNVLGKKVHSFNEGFNVGNYFTTIDMVDFPNGIYIFKIKVDNKVYYRRIYRSE